MGTPFQYLYALCACAGSCLCLHKGGEQEVVYLLYVVIDIIDYEPFLYISLLASLQKL